LTKIAVFADSFFNQDRNGFSGDPIYIDI